MNDVERAARVAGLVAGALHRGELWPIGTLVRWSGKGSKVTFRVDDLRWVGQPDTGYGNVHITPLRGGPGRSACWTRIEELRQVES